MSRAHAIISTHTARHLRRTLLGVAAQTRPPDSVTISSDADDPEIVDVTAKISAERRLAISVVARPHLGASRSSQVRNNAVRAILSNQQPADADLLWFLDGDCLPARDCLETHLRLCPPHVSGKPGSVVVAFRIDLTPEQTEAIDEHAILQGEPVHPTPEQLTTLRDRAARYRRQVLWKRLGLGKAHKPKLLSANFSLRIADYLAVNGFDEDYTGYGQEDDDLGRRLYTIGVRPIVGVHQAMVYHQYHPTRAPGAWGESPNAKRFAAPFSARCIHGVENPMAQPEPAITCFG